MQILTMTDAIPLLPVSRKDPMHWVDPREITFVQVKPGQNEECLKTEPSLVVEMRSGVQIWVNFAMEDEAREEAWALITAANEFRNLVTLPEREGD